MDFLFHLFSLCCKHNGHVTTERTIVMSLFSNFESNRMCREKINGSPQPHGTYSTKTFVLRFIQEQIALPYVHFREIFRHHVCAITEILRDSPPISIQIHGLPMLSDIQHDRIMHLKPSFLPLLVVSNRFPNRSSLIALREFSLRSQSTID